VPLLLFFFTEELKKHRHAARHCHGVCLLYGLCEMQRAPWQGRLCIVMKCYKQSLESAIAAALRAKERNI
jgi:hypothetical protein